MHTTLAIFNLNIKPNQLDIFRQACIVSSGNPQQLWNNEEKLPTGKVRNINRYPVIQYRCIGGKATLWGIDEGAKAIDNFLRKPAQPFEMMGAETQLQLFQKENNKNITVQLAKGKKMYRYRIYQWLPFNKEENYQWWLAQRQWGSDAEKTRKLESILWGHISNFATEIAGWKKERSEKIKTYLIEKSLSFVVNHNKTGFTAFDIVFATNVELPLNIGLGALKSHGFGIVVEVL